VTVPAAVLGLAEDANTYTPLGRGQERIARDEYVLWMMPGLGEAHGAVAQRLRLRPERVEPVVAELREIVRSRDRIALSWEIGSSAKPSDLVERLLALGMRLDDDPHLVAVVCTSPPEPGPNAVEVRRVEGFEDFATALRSPTPPSVGQSTTTRRASTDCGMEMRPSPGTSRSSRGGPSRPPRRRSLPMA